MEEARVQLAGQAADGTALPGRVAAFDNDDAALTLLMTGQRDLAHAQFSDLQALVVLALGDRRMRVVCGKRGHGQPLMTNLCPRP